MSFFFRKRKLDPRTTEPVRCPGCGTNQPAAAIMQLQSVFWHDGEVVNSVTGARYSCQVCAHVWSIGPWGVFTHHPDALPPPTRAIVRPGAQSEQKRDENVQQPPPLRPKGKPRV